MSKAIIFGQRRLEKVILINSSSFTYAEVPVFGNTHISGTNSTGKTTFTQALTVFYTGDASKDKLGIDTSKNPFLEHNLSGASSYIIFEVRRSDEASDRFLVVMRATGGLTFYFFDCPYSPDMFVSKDGYAYNSIERVKDAARSVYGHEIDNRKVKGRDNYIDVLYGYKNNRQFAGGDRSWLKFSLTSCIGEDRPHAKFVRLVQMMLVLGNMQGDIIKDMIVSSLDEVPDDFQIDLWTNRVRDVRNRKNIIRTWLRDPRIIQDQSRYQKAYSELVEEKRNYGLYPAMAKYARNEAIAAKEEAGKELKAAKDEYEKAQDIIEARRTARDATIEQMTKKIGGLEANLKEMERKRKTFSELMPHIGLLEMAEQVKSSLETSKANLKAVTDKNADISKEFEAMKTSIDSEIERAQMETVKVKAETSAAREAEKGRIREDEAAKDEREKTLFDQKSDIIETERENALTALSKAQKKEASLINWNPKEKEISAANDKISVIRKQREGLLKEKASLEGNAAVLEAGKEGAVNAVRLDYSSQIKEASDRITALRVEEELLKEQMESFDGSFAQWLDSVVDGWQSGIGKIIPRDILLRSDLSPRKQEDNDSIYGVAIDLSVLPPSDVSPSRIREEYSTVLEKQKTATDDFAALVKKRDDTISDCVKMIDGETDRLRSLALDKEKEAAGLSAEEAAAKDYLGALETEQKRLRDDALSKAGTDVKVATEALATANKKKDTLRKEIREYTQMAASRIKQRIAEVDRLLKEDLDSIDKAFNERKAAATLRKVKIDSDLAAILADSEVSKERIEELQAGVRSLEEKVSLIDKYSGLYINYLSAKCDYFDHEAEWQKSLSETNGELEAAKKNDEALQKTEDAKLKSLDTIVSEREEEMTLYDEAARSADEHFMTERKEEYESCEPYENDLVVSEIIRRDGESKTRQERFESEMDRIWRTFRDKLGSEGASLFFPHAARAEDFASDPAAVVEVHDFITEGRIQQYRDAWNANAVLLVSDISYHATGFTSGLVKIRDTVSGLNALFRRHNFTSVIKKFEMTVEDNRDDVVSTILSAGDVHSDYCHDWDETRRDYLDGSPSNDRFLAYIDSLANKLLSYSRPRLKLTDTFMLFFDAQEGSNRTGRTNNLNHVGSTGIDMLFKEIVYLLMLTKIRNRFDNRGESFMTHCPIDEQAKLSAENFNSLISLANSFGVFILANSPSVPAGTEESFRIANYFWKDATEHTHSECVMLLDEDSEEEGTL